MVYNQVILPPEVTFSLWKPTSESAQKSSLQLIAIVPVAKIKFCFLDYRYLAFFLFLLQLLPNINLLAGNLLFGN